jgi:hypothetical protein
MNRHSILKELEDINELSFVCRARPIEVIQEKSDSTEHAEISS